MAESVAIDMRDITVTPLFRYEGIEDINASEREGHLVKNMVQVVEVRFAGSKNYAPVFPVDAMWKRENGRTITYAERWPEQYRSFLAGSSQEALGTPLEMLKSYGMSDANLSLCRALRIYSIEALNNLEGDNLKSLGVVANVLKDMARAYLADRSRSGSDADELAALKAEIAALKAASVQVIPEKEMSAAKVEELVERSNDEYAGMSDDEIKDRIAGITGAGRPRGNPSRTTLVQSLKTLEAPVS